MVDLSLQTLGIYFVVSLLLVLALATIAMSIIRIGPNEVTFRQNLNDPQSVKPFRDVTKQLNATIKQ